MAKSPHGRQQVLEAHGDVKPVEHALGWPRQSAGEVDILSAVRQNGYRRVWRHAERGEEGLLPDALVRVVRAGVRMRVTVARLWTDKLGEATTTIQRTPSCLGTARM